MRRLTVAALFAAAALVVGVIVWAALASNGGVPDPTVANTGPITGAVDIGVLVFREGLESILVLAAITAGMVAGRDEFRRAIAVGVAAGLVATLATWFIAVGILDSLADNVSALALQAATGLLAIVVLLVVMNWFFHKVYWAGWISLHNKRKRNLLRSATSGVRSQKRVFWGLALLGFTSLYREGFEVVLFLQSYRLRLGGSVVLNGVVCGLVLTAIVGALTFFGHRRLPYRRMLVVTGILLGVVLLVMVGEEAQEMQLAHWLPTTPVIALQHRVPDWLGLWFAVFPTAETLLAQLIAALAVVGSYVMARVSLSHAD